MKLQVTLDEALVGKPLNRFWSTCVGAGRANEGLRAGWQRQLAKAVESCDFRYVRFHGLFHDDMFVYKEINGQVSYNFQYVDELFDALLDIGIRPFVEFGFCPGDLATEKGTVFWWKGHGSPPKDYGKWGALIRATVEHWIERYGIDEVRSWYFEVWNEPNLNPFFRGTRSQYFELYKTTAQALKGVDAQLRVGGPATSNFVPDARFDGETEDMSCHKTVIEAEDLDGLDWRPVWVEAFLEYCRREGLPVDFVSCHPYPTDWALDEHGTGKQATRGVDATPRDVALLRTIVAESAFPNAEIHLTEWSATSTSRDFSHDYLQSATYVVRTVLRSLGQADSLSYWTFTDIFEEGGAGAEIFHGGFGMINFQGIVKPVFHAYRFLNALGDELLASGSNGVVTRDKARGRLSALFHHYPSEMPLSVPVSSRTRDVAESTLALGSALDLDVLIRGMRPNARVTMEVLDKTHGNAMAAWMAMGAPKYPSREDTEKLRRAAESTRMETLCADGKGVLSFKMAMEPWSLVLLREERVS